MASNNNKIKILKNKEIINCIMANISAICQQTAHTTYQLSSPSCSTRAIQKSLTLLNQKMVEQFLKKMPGEWTITHSQRNDMAESARGLGKKMREEIRNRNQMTILRFQTGSKTSDILGLLFRSG